MKMKKRIVVLLMALVLAVGLIGCKDTLKSIVHKASGTSDEVQEEDTTRWADQTSDPLIIQGIADSSAKFATARRMAACMQCSTASGAARPATLPCPPAR